MSVFFSKISRGYSIVVTNKKKGQQTTFQGIKVTVNHTRDLKFGLYTANQRNSLYNKYSNCQPGEEIKELEFTEEKIPNTKKLFKVVESEVDY